jgi:hypothetical protein
MTAEQEKAKLKMIIESLAHGSKANADKLIKEAMNQKIFNRFKSVLTKESK